MRYFTVFALLLGVLVSAGWTSALAENKVSANLCIEYSGTFIWDEPNPDIQNMRVRFSSINYGLQGQITASGTVYYNINGELSSSETRVEIDRNTLRFEMWEKSDNNPDFVSDGSHVGKIAADLSQVNAVWTTRSNGETGKLKLKALDACLAQ